VTEHLALPTLTAFAARYHLSAQVRARVGRSDDESRLLKQIRSDADLFASLKQCTLEENFSALRAKIESQKNLFQEAISDGLSESLTALCEALGDYSCGRCSVNMWCSHDAKTFENVNNGGKCIEPLKDLVNDLTSWIESLWRQCPDGGSPPQIIFSTTDRAFEQSGPITRRYHVGGYALSIGRRGTYKTKVGLEIVHDKFEWDQFNYLTYILLHEILCHAFQSLDNPPLRENADPNDIWSEGWMDALAHVLALEWLAEHPKKLRYSEGEVDFARSQTTQLHEARYASPARDSRQLTPSDGKAAFDVVRSSYSDAIRKLPMSKQPLTKFSLRMNAITMPMSERIRPLLPMSLMAKQDPAKLHRIIGAFVATPNWKTALEQFRQVIP
jgi:hypothetical protein